MGKKTFTRISEGKAGYETTYKWAYPCLIKAVIIKKVYTKILMWLFLVG